MTWKLLLSRAFLPMPAAAVCWMIIMSIVDEQKERAGLIIQGTGPSYSDAMYVAGVVMMMFLGGMLQFCIGWPLTRKLVARQASAGEYFNVGLYVAAGFLTIPLICVVGGMSSGESLSSLEFILFSFSVSGPIYVCFGIRGVIEHASAPDVKGGAET